MQLWVIQPLRFLGGLFNVNHFRLWRRLRLWWINHRVQLAHEGLRISLLNGIAGCMFNIALPSLMAGRLKAQVGKFVLVELSVDPRFSLKSRPTIILRKGNGGFTPGCCFCFRLLTFALTRGAGPLALRSPIARRAEGRRAAPNPLSAQRYAAEDTTWTH
jgi:hypothetical protein